MLQKNQIISNYEFYYFWNFANGAEETDFGRFYCLASFKNKSVSGNVWTLWSNELILLDLIEIWDANLILIIIDQLSFLYRHHTIKVVRHRRASSYVSTNVRSFHLLKFFGILTSQRASNAPVDPFTLAIIYLLKINGIPIHNRGSEWWQIILRIYILSEDMIQTIFQKYFLD